QVVEDCVLFTLHRSKFREMLALSTSASLVQRVAWMVAIPELEPLDKQSTSRLAGAFNTLHLRNGEPVMLEGDSVDKCFMVEYGRIEVTSKAMSMGGADAVRKQLSATFPKERTNSAASSTRSGASGYTPMQRKRISVRSGGSWRGGGGGEPGRAGKGRDGGEEGGGDNRNLPLQEPSDITAPPVYGPGTFLGMPILLCAGGGKKSKGWAPAAKSPALTEPGNGNSSRDEHEEEAGDAEGESEGKPPQFKGAQCPVNIRAKGDLRISYFTVGQFEAIVGHIRDVFSLQLRGRPSLLRKHHEERFTVDDFQTEVFLGTGSFGRVTLVTFRDKMRQEESNIRGIRHFALKALSKKAVIERGQLAHVKDERLLLQNMEHPLIIELFSTFQQDANSIYFLMEAVTAGEMWSIIYEGSSGYKEGELPIEHGRQFPSSMSYIFLRLHRFYVACVLEALAYMHDRGVAYRDLKPENIMVDAEGYPRLIDLGFAKKIPFTIEVDGKQEVHPKSFTMCGTPEYLAPEFIFNSGHDRSVDCWALGVLTFEFTGGYTPFQPPNLPGDMTALFTRIASSKRDGIVFPPNYDTKAKGKESRDIVVKLLQPDPTLRLGNLAGGSDDIRKHPYFATIDWQKLAHKKMEAPWKPPQEMAPPPADEGDHKDVAVYTGDDSLFAEW
ncbi:unnamed protein product, partial [Discosporangium mesarthrocarpum]